MEHLKILGRGLLMILGVVLTVYLLWGPFILSVETENWSFMYLYIINLLPASYLVGRVHE